MDMDLHSYLTQQAKWINKGIGKIFSDMKTDSRIVNAMAYSVMAGGKRIRPILCVAAADAVGGDKKDVLPVACALELIHTYSLIHDDLPAMDNDDLRRGAPTCHIKYDEATAILAGDALQTLAFDIISDAGLKNPVNAPQYLAVVQILAKAAGSNGMIEGQMRDMDAEGRELSLNALKSMHELKTGAMIECAVHIGALICGGNEKQLSMLRIYGEKIGLAFQVTDDILNVKGNPDIMGKAVGTDMEKMKNTYPSLMGIERSETYAKKQIEDALKAIDVFDNKAAPLRAIANYILQRNR